MMRLALLNLLLIAAILVFGAVLVVKQIVEALLG
jgi:hypothetical protein